jgi:hypothetical protein
MCDLRVNYARHTRASIFFILTIARQLPTVPSAIEITVDFPALHTQRTTREQERRIQKEMRATGVEYTFHLLGHSAGWSPCS